MAKPGTAGHIGVMLSRFFGRRPSPRAAPEAPSGTRIYAIGDIHGCDVLLERLHGLIRADAADADSLRKVIVYLGDYVDRGEGSRRVIDMLVAGPPPGFEAVYLCGNHEEMTLSFLEDSAIAPMWMMNGGNATLYSYGVRFGDAATPEARYFAMQKAFRAALPESHLDFLRGLAPYYVEGDYLFVHAGVAPGRPLEEQQRQDLLWIRDEFLDSSADHGYCVVHGHSIVDEPDQRPNRIAIDTGAYYSGTLTCLVLEGDERRFLHS
jgi:serine/threonine protein phosphatase 1